MEELSRLAENIHRNERILSLLIGLSIIQLLLMEELSNLTPTLQFLKEITLITIQAFMVMI